MLVKSSDELIGNTEYFNTFYSLIKKPEIQYSFYKFLMEREVKQTLTIADIPITETMLDAYALNKDIVQDFVENVDDGEHSTAELYADFQQFCCSKGFKDNMNERRFSMKFAEYAKKNPFFTKVVKDNMKDGKRITFKGWNVKTTCIVKA